MIFVVGGYHLASVRLEFHHSCGRQVRECISMADLPFPSCLLRMLWQGSSGELVLSFLCAGFGDHLKTVKMRVSGLTVIKPASDPCLPWPLDSLLHAVLRKFWHPDLTECRSPLNPSSSLWKMPAGKAIPAVKARTLNSESLYKHSYLGTFNMMQLCSSCLVWYP